eukprot:jgi/Tetstr1/424312/TSEL_014879.t1
MSVPDFRAMGRSVECKVLHRAVKWHLEDRVFMVEGNKTVVFSEQQPDKEDEDGAYGFGDNSPSDSDGSGGLWSCGSDEADYAGATQSIQGSQPATKALNGGALECATYLAGAVKEGARQQAEALKEEGR